MWIPCIYIYNNDETGVLGRSRKNIRLLFPPPARYLCICTTVVTTSKLLFSYTSWLFTHNRNSLHTSSRLSLSSCDSTTIPYYTRVRRLPALSPCSFSLGLSHSLSHTHTVSRSTLYNRHRRHSVRSHQLLSWATLLHRSAIADRLGSSTITTTAPHIGRHSMRVGGEKKLRELFFFLFIQRIYMYTIYLHTHRERWLSARGGVACVL